MKTAIVVSTSRAQRRHRSKAICLFVNMDRMVGGMFEQGLQQMKSVVESKR